MKEPKGCRARRRRQKPGRPEAMEGRPLPCLPPASHSLRALFEALPRRSPAPRLCRPILAGRSPAPFRQNCQKRDRGQALNIKITSKGLRPAGLFRSVLRRASVKMGRNISKLICLANSSKGSLKRLNAASLLLSSKKEVWYDFIQ